jgi:hypothetical protein
MKLSPVTRCGVALVLFFLLTSTARAEFIHWMYTWSRNPTQINADAPGTGYITLTGESLRSAVGDSDIVATNLRVYSTAPPDNPDIFTAKPYTLSLFLYDTDSAQSLTLAFSGQFDGTATVGSANIKNTFHQRGDSDGGAG